MTSLLMFLAVGVVSPVQGGSDNGWNDLLVCPTNAIGTVAWRNFSEEPGTALGDVWVFTNNMLVCRGKPRGYLVLAEKLSDFELSFEWKRPEGKKPGKAGVLMRMSGPDRIWPKSLEAQLNAGQAGDFWGLGGFELDGPAERKSVVENPQQGRLTNLKRTSDHEKPVGEWNIYEIIAHGAEVTLRINGIEVNRATKCDQVAGPLCLTAEGDEIHFRNVRLRKLADQTGDTWKKEILNKQIKAFCIDFNWGPKGVNGFAGPGHWGDADPAAHVAWYEKLGANVIQTFAVSCNGYAWFKGGKIPEQPGMKHDFLPEVVKLGHAKKMMVMGYFCIAANTRWGQNHPDLSYGFKSEYHIPFTDEYLDYLAMSIEEALRISGMDGFMIDWVWNPTDAARKSGNGGKWLGAEKGLFKKLMGKEFPGEEQLSKEDKLAYERRAIDRCWAKIRDAAKKTNPDCVIWLSCNKVSDPTSIDSNLYKQVDWLMDESGNPAAMKGIAGMLGEKTKQVLCLVGWGDKHDARKVLSDPATKEYAIYGFSRPGENSLPLPVETYFSKPIDEFNGNDKNIAVLARFFNGKAWDYTSQK